MSRSYKDGKNGGAHKLAIHRYGFNREYRATCSQALRNKEPAPDLKIRKRWESKED